MLPVLEDHEAAGLDQGEHDGVDQIAGGLIVDCLQPGQHQSSKGTFDFYIVYFFKYIFVLFSLLV